MKINSDLIKQAIELIISFIKPAAVAPKPAKPPEMPKQPEAHKETEPNWNDPSSKISKYFTVKEAIMLREWGRLADEQDGLNDHVKAQLIGIFKIMDTIREILNRPIFIKSAYRPKKYNVAIGGATFSAHMAEKDYAAVDFWCDQDGDGDKDGKDCDDIKAILMPKLAELGIRMEDNGKGAKWVHVDNKPVATGGNRFFKP